ncbi:glycoside hydrolase family 16 protein [Daldinia caldariorum]|uniref:glycoside hydrolase family 16 protein n=1 Tax=Daldinia caldariorum TaxID=326644 RepID=UPI00200784B7|nr:glycoside hydrolase family 16 protein [Daldinia caldariorum]KAI1472737.1 glycoside hydrolase family 16 protein [Daldinia caldariorum]
MILLSQTPLWTAVLTALSFLIPEPAAAQTPASPALCQCYLINGSSPQYFANHKFFDFRDIANPREPAPINDRNASTNAPVTHPYFTSPNFTTTWSIQNWVDTRGPLYNTYSKNEVYIGRNADVGNASSRTALTLRTYRHRPGNFQSSAEVQSVSPDYRFLSVRMHSRTRGAPGAVAAMFTYRGGGAGADDVQEADMEIRTSDPNNKIHYTNQPSTARGVPRPNATREVTIPGTWTSWRTHRYDWTPGLSTWYVDGQPVASNAFQAPVDPATLLFNVWSNGGSWSGAMPPGQSAQMQIQWIELIYNNTAEPPRFARCAKVCSLDLGTEPGVPSLVGSSGP